MLKKEILATSFILTLTVISTAPVKSANKAWNLDFLQKTKKIAANKYTYDLAENSILSSQELFDSNTLDFDFSNSLESKNIKKATTLNNFNLVKSLRKKFNYSELDRSTVFTSVKHFTKSNLDFTSQYLNNLLAEEVTIQVSNINTLKTEISPKNKINNLTENLEAWATNSQQSNTLDIELEENTVFDFLPITSLIITGLFCIFSAKKSPIS